MIIINIHTRVYIAKAYVKFDIKSERAGEVVYNPHELIL